ncbi:hypothetical protein WJ973_06595 [Achromobacter xylosoxidans]
MLARDDAEAVAFERALQRGRGQQHAVRAQLDALADAVAGEVRQGLAAVGMQHHVDIAHRGLRVDAGGGFVGPQGHAFGVGGGGRQQQRGAGEGSDNGHGRAPGSGGSMSAS